MKFDLDDYVQRDHNFCIVDEVDSILLMKLELLYLSQDQVKETRTSIKLLIESFLTYKKKNTILSMKNPQLRF
jgi:preprotein translocase subunit SecA